MSRIVPHPAGLALAPVGLKGPRSFSPISPRSCYVSWKRRSEGWELGRSGVFLGSRRELMDMYGGLCCMHRRVNQTRDRFALLVDDGSEAVVRDPHGARWLLLKWDNFHFFV
eukprot:c19913_g1_i2.p3 GENE.c19913_g1_i2~~c19913_g1_i2.p3  ORF type:complete len:112 (+),score=0.02 c19913_g1_i2:441-776(+)